ncbi:MAG: hypothetical protein IJ334_16410 [Clostridia bacterium]|nr:hypothetical protein [Clostridia bacterium]
MNLTELCAHLRNWFVRDDSGKHIGTYSVIAGELELPFLAQGQYFRIIGSVFNDGVWQYPAVLTDETFEGAVWAMAVPLDVISLLSDIDAWEEKYREAAESPYQSESFGGYTYTKAGGTGGDSGGVTWQTVFKSRLNRWRKL